MGLTGTVPSVWGELGPGPAGVCAADAGPGPGPSGGEGLVIAIIDTGITANHPSFSDKAASASGKEAQCYQPLGGGGKAPRFRGDGACYTGADGKAVRCGGKLVACRGFNARAPGVKNGSRPYGTDSCRDGAMPHGTFVAGVAGGNFHAVTTDPIPTRGGTRQRLSGIAPRARLAVYKTCDFSGNDSPRCLPKDIVAGIEQAVKDGVDVINLSQNVGGPLNSSVNMALIRAAAAGVLVSGAAGNSGSKGASSIDQHGPWMITVGAGTHDRSYPGGALRLLPSGRELATVAKPTPAMTNGTAALPLLLAERAGRAGQEPSSSCSSDYLDPGKVAGKLLLCGGDSFTNGDVVDAAKAAGAGGVAIVIDTLPQLTYLWNDWFTLPVVLLSPADGAIARAAANSSKPALASIVASHYDRAAAPTVAAFSSRGPLRDFKDKRPGADNSDTALFQALVDKLDKQGPNAFTDFMKRFNGSSAAVQAYIKDQATVDVPLLKPDLIAPGVDIVSAADPATSLGSRPYKMSLGTSFAAPHVSGVAALIKQKHPTWSPMRIKSALQTTARPSQNMGAPIPGTPFDFGSGEVDPLAALAPGLVFDSGLPDWLDWLCGLRYSMEGVDCTARCKQPAGRLCRPLDLNTPSITLPALPLAGATVTRTLTSVASKTAKYQASVQAPPGLTIKVVPRSFELAPGKKQLVVVTVAPAQGKGVAPGGGWAFGAITWQGVQPGSRTRTRIPVAVKLAAAAKAPAAGR